MAKTTSEMLTELMHLSGPRPQSAAQLIGGLREMYAVKLTRKKLKQAFFANQVLFKRDGSTSFRLDEDARLDRLVQELFGTD